MRGDYDYLDGVVVPNTCDIVFSMSYFWKTLVTRTTKPVIVSGMDMRPNLFYINYPAKVTGREVVHYYMDVLRGFKRELERSTKRSITDDDLVRTIAIYNEDKAQLRRMYEMRKSIPPGVSGYEAWQIVWASLMMPKDEHAQALKGFLNTRESKSTTHSEPARIYLSGSTLDCVNKDFIKLVEEYAIVVSDDLCVGTRSFWHQLDTKLHPLEAIARRSLGVACPRSTTAAPIPEDRWAHILETTDGFHVEGAIFHVLRCCDARLSETPHLSSRFIEELGIPVLALEEDYGPGAVGQLRLRVEAFVEMIQMAKEVDTKAPSKAQ